MDGPTVEVPVTDAICGLPIPYGGIGRLMPNLAHLTPFCGNQWNDAWRWDRDAVHTHYASKATAKSALAKWIRTDAIKGVMLRHNGQRLVLYPEDTP